MKTTKIVIKMTIYSRSSAQNVKNWRLWIMKNALLDLIKEQDSDNLIGKI